MTCIKSYGSSEFVLLLLGLENPEKNFLLLVFFLGRTFFVGLKCTKPSKNIPKFKQLLTTRKEGGTKEKKKFNRMHRIIRRTINGWSILDFCRALSRTKEREKSVGKILLTAFKLFSFFFKDKHKEKNITLKQSDASFTVFIDVANLQLVCNTLHVSHVRNVRLFIVPVTLDVV